MTSETALYAPVKALLEQQGYTVKAEVGTADVVARRNTELLIVELKVSFSLVLLQQAVARLALTDAVYVAVARKGSSRSQAFRSNLLICKRLGLGVITVRLSDGATEVHCDPAPFTPRKSSKRRQKMLREFDRLVGDPNLGGTSGARMTAYRQDALACAAALARSGPCAAAIIAQAAGRPNARSIMYKNHYGWFLRPEKGVYDLTENGHQALAEYNMLAG